LDRSRVSDHFLDVSAFGLGVAGAGAFSRGVTGAAVVGVAGAVAGVRESGWSSTDVGTRVRVDAICSKKQRNRNTPPDHQLALVNRFPACRVPINASVDELAPPKLAASPPPLPDCKRIAAIRTTLSRKRRMSRNLYSMRGADAGRIRLETVST
jgi:hypothetical protein